MRNRKISKENQKFEKKFLRNEELAVTHKIDLMNRYKIKLIGTYLRNKTKLKLKGTLTRI